jgi:hypothetical protein
MTERRHDAAGIATVSVRFVAAVSLSLSTIV